MRGRTVYQTPTNRPPGFTLVEVLVTLVIIAIVAGISAPAILSMAPNMTLKSAAQELYSNIQEAKILAVKENREIGVRIGTAGYTVGEPFTDTNGDGLYAAPEAYTDSDGDGAYTAAKTIIFANEYDYGIGLGTGNATADWNNLPCATVGNPCNIPAATITFNSRGLANADSAFIQNSNNDMSFAISITVAGAVKIRKYGGADPFDENNWTE